MKKVSKILLLGIMMFHSLATMACTVGPVDVAKEATELKRFVAPMLSVTDENMLSLDLTHAVGGYIWHDMMCPEGIAVQATFSAIYVKAGADSEEICEAKLKVSKTQPTGLSDIKLKNETKVEILGDINCSH